ncbi:MAG TPA: NDP-sugar synthase [Acidimicrobiales bacterium]|nr:NDP-sugar synthase [Acidimicrobiales bacterium]
MKAVVLVGGRGTRLLPLTETAPKQMLPVAGRPMIEWVLEHLAAHGIDEVVLSLGYRPDAFTDAYPDGTACGVALRYAVEGSPLDTAGAIAFAARHAGLREPFVVVNGDVLTSLDVGALVAFHAERGAEATIALTPVADPSRFGVVPTDEAGRVLAFIEKPPAGTAPTNLINAGTYVLEPSVLDRIPEGRPTSIERVTFPALVDEQRLYAMASDADWVDAGTPATYIAANLARAGSTAGGEVHPDATVRRSVVGAGATVAAGAVVDGSLLLDGARVAEGAQVRDSIVGWGAVVGAGASVAEGCVLGAAAVVGAGASLAATTVP